ncbi:MAG: DNA-deoxyinosine glycosylase [Firmicutes bacterium]|uniref:DNA-deoxyinosine glycosylase n=1 Tax=Candidatus Onthovivens merdipullorum TaxID=2840889 RepID=A0A9D9DJD5_9BACL|nr:DNA-deoxyinosine glycosylase [Candidatus Onthovivens merdipullorum]
MKKFLVICDSFKGSLSSSKINLFLAKSLQNSDYFPMSDGGEGFLEAIKHLKEGKVIKRKFSDLLEHKRSVEIFIDQDNNAYFESSSLIGLNLIKTSSIFDRTSFGLGEVLIYLNTLNIKSLYIGLGGSGTSELGIGLLYALGAKFYFKEIEIVKPKISDLDYITKIDLTNIIKLNYQINLVTDVDSPLLGKFGANKFFAKQKGASPLDITRLEKLFNKFLAIVSTKLTNLEDTKGDGAVGGIGFSLKHLLNAKYIEGSEFMLDLISYDKIITNYEYIITGEGSFDIQSFHNKLVGKIISKTPKEKLIIISGINKTKYKKHIYSIYKTYTNDLNDATKNPLKYLAKIVKKIKVDFNIVNKVSHTFPIFINDDSNILILGSFPSVKSREENFYYMNPYNRFYKVLAVVYNEVEPLSLLNKNKFLSKHKIALYDVIEECEIDGSKDDTIKNEVVIDLDSIMNKYHIKKILLNGSKAFSVFKKYFFKYLPIAYSLPSTSPLNINYSVEKLIELYKNALI